MVRFLEDNIGKIMSWANVLFLFLFSIHLFNFPDKFIILWCVFSIGVFWLQYKKLCLDKMFWILALAIGLNGLGTYYYLAENLSYTFGDIIKLVVPTILVYPFMKQAVCDKNEADVLRIIMAIAIGTFVYSLLNYSAYLEHGFSYGSRIWVEFWTDYPMNATHHSYWGCFVVGLVGYAIYCIMQKKWLNVIVVTVFVAIENYIQIVVDNRMVLCTTFVALVVAIILFLCLNRKDKKIMRNCIAIIIAVAVLVAIAFVFDVLGVRSSGYIQRFVTRDGGIIKNIRFQMIIEAIKMLPSHWKGGADMWAAGVYHVHNYWLQVANVSGIIPFVLWMIVNISAIVDVVKLVKSAVISQKIKLTLIPMLASIVGYLMMEPGGTEANRYIIFYVILIALLKQLANVDKPNVGEEDVQVSSEI